MLPHLPCYTVAISFMLPITAFVFGGAAVAAGSYLYSQFKEFDRARTVRRVRRSPLVREAEEKWGSLRDAAGVIYTEARPLLNELSESEFAEVRWEFRRQRRKLTIAISHTVAAVEHQYQIVREDAQTVASAVYEEAQIAFHDLGRYSPKTRGCLPIAPALHGKWPVRRRPV